MRNVTFHDSLELLGWRNETQVSKYSHSKGLISLEAHTKWIRERLDLLPMQPFWIFENGLNNVGFTRFDRSLDLEEFVISIVINPSLRGKGFGTTILNMSIERCLEENFGIDFYAEAHRDNPASQAIFLKCGFHEVGASGDFLGFKRFANAN